MLLNAARRRILKLVIAILLLMTLFPPFIVIRDNSTLNVGYSFLLYPPTTPVDGGTVNAYTLLVQYLFVMTMGGLAFLLAEGSSPNEKG